jgi:DNA-binding IclR family transcriptional regulator
MTLELLLAEQGPMTAQELSRALQKPIEDVYERLVSLEGNGIATLKVAYQGHYFYESLWNIE